MSYVGRSYTGEVYHGTAEQVVDRRVSTALLYVVTLDGTDALEITTTSLPDATKDVAYSETVEATGGTEPYTWAVTAGSLPSGLSLNASTGEISGTPDTVESQTFTVQVTDDASATDTQELTIAVTEPDCTGDYCTDFSEYATGAGLPTGWEHQWDDTATFAVEDEDTLGGGAVGGRLLRQTNNPDQANKFVRWTDVPDGRYEVRARVWLDNSTGLGATRRKAGVVIFGSGDHASRTGYTLDAVVRSNNDTGYRLEQFVDGASVASLQHDLFSESGNPWDINAWNWIELLYNADLGRLEARLWPDDSSRPEDPTATLDIASPIESGGVGIHTFQAVQATGIRWDVVEVDVELAPAAPTLEGSAPDTTAFLSTDAFVPGADGMVHHSSEWMIRPDGAADWESETLVGYLLSEDDLTVAVIEDLPAETDLEARARHIGELDGTEYESAWSNVLELTTSTEVTRPDTPVLTIDDVGLDYVQTSRGEFSHPDGTQDPPDGSEEDDDILPWHLASQYEVRDRGTTTVVLDTGLSSERTALVQLFDAVGDPGDELEIRVRDQDGKYGVTSEWSAWVPFDLSTLDPLRPNTPTLTMDVCAPEGIEVSGSAYVSGDDPASAHVATRWWIGTGPLADITWRSVITEVAGELTSFTWPHPPPAIFRLAVSYQDADGRWSERSEPETCEIVEPPPQPTFTACLGAVAEDTLIEWDMVGGPAEAWEFEGELSEDGGATWTELFGRQVAESHLFEVAGRANGDWLVRVRACYDEAGECGAWAYLPVTIDRTGQVVVPYNFPDLAELPATWDKGWDPSDAVSFSLVNSRLEATPPYVGILARNHQHNTNRVAVLRFNELGEPDELDATIVFAWVPRDATQYTWRYAYMQELYGGLGYRIRTGAENEANRSGVTQFAHPGGPGTPYPSGCTTDTGMTCPCGFISDELCPDMSVAAAWTQQQLPDRLIRYGVSRGRAGWRIQRRRPGSSVPIQRTRSISEEGALIRGADGSRQVATAHCDAGSECEWSFRWYTARYRIRRVSAKSHRFQAQLLGPGIDPSLGFQLDEVYQTADLGLLGGDDLPCGPCGLAFRHLQNLTQDHGVLFRCATFSNLEYANCDPPDDPLIGCIADWDFTTFEPDDVTPQYGTADEEGQVAEADYYSDRSCPRPYLIVPEDFSETEIDYPAGASTIGAITVEVVDKRLEPSDQNSGIVTAILDDVVGRRAVLRRFRADLGMVTVFDGVVDSYVIDEELARVRFHLRDPRERERETSLFSNNETFAIFAGGGTFGRGTSGPIEPYGALPGGGHLIDAVEPWQSIFENINHFQRYNDPDPEDGIYFGFSNVDFIPLMDELGWPQLDEDGLWRYIEITVRWRPKGSSDDWIYLRNMPRARYENAVSFFQVPGVGAFPVPALYFGSFDSEEVPVDDQEIEFQVLAVNTTPRTPFFWDNGTFGDLLLEIYDGQHTLSPPNIRFNRAALEEWALNTPPARMILYEPVEDMREWVQENIFAPLAHAPSFDPDMRIIPSAWQLPSADETLIVLDLDWIIPVGEWTHELDSVINRVNYTYIREFIRPNEPGEDLPPWERLIERDVVRRRLFAPSSFLGANTIEYEPVTVRAIGDQDGRPLSGDVTDELGSQLATMISQMVLDRYGWGAPEFTAGVRAGMAWGSTFDPLTLDLEVGQWIIARIPWAPDYADGFRGAERLMQIKSIQDVDIAERRLRLVDGGAELDPLDPPTLGSLSLADDMRVEVPVTAFPGSAPADYRARVDFAIAATEPSSGSGLWQLAGTTDEAGTSVLTPQVPSGARVWIRARGEAALRRPSSWTTAVFLDADQRPGLLALGLGLNDDTPVLTWTPNQYTEGIRVRYSVHTIGTSAGSLTTWGDLDASLGSAVLHGISVGVGQQVTVEVTSYPTWSPTAGVSGDPGWTHFVQALRSDADAPFLEWAEAERTDDGACGESVNDPIVNRVSWQLSGSISGHTIRILRDIVGVGAEFAATGLTASPYDDERDDVEHDPATGIRTEYRYRVELVRTEDSAVIQTQNAPPLVNYEDPCLES